MTQSSYDGAFIVSSGRCGSTLMSNLVDIHPGMTSISELFACVEPRAFVLRNPTGKQFWKLLSQVRPGVSKALNPENCPDEFLYPLDQGRYTNATLPPILRVTLPFLFQDPDAVYDRLQPLIEERPRAPLAQHYRFLFDWIAQEAGSPHWVERSGASLSMVREIHKHFPEAKLVHVYRDGRDVALSINNHPGVRAFAHNWVRFRKIGIDLMREPFELSSNRLIAFAEPFAQHIVNLDKQLVTPLPLKDIGAFWSAMVEIGVGHLKSVPAKQKYDVCYEELVAEPVEHLREFIRFVDPALECEDWLYRAAQMPRRGRSNWKDLPKADRDELEKACAPGLEVLGYAA